MSEVNTNFLNSLIYSGVNNEVQFQYLLYLCLLESRLSALEYYPLLQSILFPDRVPVDILG